MVKIHPQNLWGAPQRHRQTRMSGRSTPSMLLNVGMPTWHPHPKNPSWPLPFGSASSVLVLFLFGRLCLRGFAALPAACSFAHVMQSEYVGRMVHGTMAPLPSLSQSPFGAWARDDQPFDYPVKWVVFAPPSPSIGP